VPSYCIEQKSSVIGSIHSSPNIQQLPSKGQALSAAHGKGEKVPPKSIVQFTARIG
jgi:hypothetical protein